MKRLMTWTGVCATVPVLAVAARADDEGKIALDKVPANVKAALKAKYPKAEVVEAEKGNVDGTKVFEFKLKEGAKEWEVAFTTDGKFLAEEKVKEKKEEKKDKDK